MAKKKIPQKMIPWIEAKKRHRLNDVQVQMARELGMNPKKLGKLDNHKQEPWKLPLPQFIEKIYLKTFKRPRPISGSSGKNSPPRPAETGQDVQASLEPESHSPAE